MTLTKADVGLGNVDNTSDLAKPVSSATQAALNGKANASVTISAGTGLTGGGDLTSTGRFRSTPHLSLVWRWPTPLFATTPTLRA
ncbi:hypothetical protein ACFFJB_01995 [Camelimonas abortus]|uniref:hypothetical protein n=1 Tax=Camelimonas abortus TaxID=1017184 RepID=UPI0035E94443